jgi:hypothetical protein
MSWKRLLQKLRAQPTVSVPEAGQALGGLGKNASYEAARRGTLGVPVMDVGGLKRVASIAVLRKLGLDPDSAADRLDAAPSRKPGRVTASA